MEEKERNVTEEETQETVTEAEETTEEILREEAAEPDPEQEEAASDKGKKKKKEKKDKKDERIEELEDRVKRQLAEFENFRNRSEKEKASMYEMGAKSVLEKILPVIDNFERGLAAIPEGEEETPLATGMKMIYKQLTTELENLGVKPIESVGCEFDPNLHNAVMQTESEEYESGIIAQELQKGYMYHETVIRHSMVSVVQ